MKLGSKIFALFSLITGAVLGLLFAPKKGSQTRKDLQKEIEKGGYGSKTLADTAKKMGEDISETSKEIYNSKQVQDGKDKLVDKAKSVYEEAKKQASKAKEELETKFREMKDSNDSE